MLAPDLDDDLAALAELAQQIAEERLSPIVEESELAATFSPKIRTILGDAGFFGLVVPPEHGGFDSNVFHQVVVLEQIAAVYPSACTYLTAHWLATKIIALNAEAGAAWVGALLQKAATGSALGAIAVTEPDAGSDLSAATTTADQDGEEWIIRGVKRFITNGGFADFYTVLARTGGPGAKGLSMFYVEADRAGVSAARWEKKMGLHGSATAEMIFDSVRVPRDHLIGELGHGFAYLMRGFDEGRLGVAAMCLGISQGAMDASIRYAAERRQFGAEISSFQGVQFLIADMSIGVYASRSLVYDAARALVAERPDRSRLSAVAKTFASDTSMSVTTNAVQVHGGAGYVRDFPVEMFMRDAKIGQIYEGTNQILRSLIARSHFPKTAR